MVLTELCVLSVLFTARTESASPANAIVPAVVRQDPNATPVVPGRSRSPSGGTPEPASMLLVAGAVMAYGAVRRRAGKVAAKVTADA